MTKKAYGLIGFALLCSVALADEYGYHYKEITSEEAPISVTLRSGERLVLSNFRSYWNSQLQSNARVIIEFPDGDSLDFLGGFMPGTYTGPCTVNFSAANNGGYVYFNYQLIRASDNSINPSNVISLPADIGGDMQLVFESSDDLLSWTQQFSFTHNSTNQASKFFRTRLIQGSGE